MVVQPLRVAGFIVNCSTRRCQRRLFEVFDRPAEITDAPPAAAPTITSALRIDHLSYRYPGASVDAIADLSLAIAPGETVAIMGRQRQNNLAQTNC